jgi:serine/threonine protein kinase
MKRCPQCHREFADRILYCVVDGQPLEDAGDAEPAPPAATPPRRLAELLDAESPMAVPRAARLILAISAAMAEKHRAGVAGAGLDPMVIAIEEPAGDGEPRVKLDAEPKPGAQAVSLLSAPYTAPESATPRQVGATADVYSVGAIAYKMLAGEPPFVAATTAALRVKQQLERPRPLVDLRPDVPPRLAAIIMHAIDKEPLARPASAAALRAEIKAALAASPAPPVAREITGAVGEPLRDSGPTLAPQSAPPPVPMAQAPAPQMAYAAPPAPSRGQMSPSKAAEPSRLDVTLPARSSSKRLLIIAIIAALASLAVIVIYLTFSLRSSAPSTESTGTPAPTMPSPTATANQNASAQANRNTPNQRPRPPQPITATPPQPQPTLQPTPAPPERQPTPRASGVPAWLLLAAIAAGALALVALMIFLLRRQKAPPAPLVVPPWLGQSSGLPPPEPHLPYPMKREEEYKTPPPLAPRPKVRKPAAETPLQPNRAAAETPAQETIKRCPSCQSEYPVSMRFCVHDGTALQEESRTVPPKDGPSFYDLQTIETRKRCPLCGTDYPLTKNFCRADGQPLIEIKSPPPAVRAPEMEPIVIGQYRCFARLGEGGMGVVYKAQHVHLKRLSAIKVLLPQTAMLPDAVQMFRREAQLASSINHPNSVIIYDYGELDATLFYLAMEFIAGQSLAEIIAPTGVAQALPLGRALDITRQVADVLEVAHRLGIVHRDLKPQNVMVTTRPGGDMIKVVDFGIARSLKLSADYATLPGVIVGTPAYMSPEQARGMPDLDGRSDIYSLGVMVYLMLSGALPFPVKGVSVSQQVDQRAHLSELPPALNDLRPELDIPRAVNDAVMRALDPDRERRFQTAFDFIEALTRAARPAH